MGNGWFENRENLSTERLEDIRDYYQKQIRNLDPSSDSFEYDKAMYSETIDAINQTLASRQQSK